MSDQERDLLRIRSWDNYTEAKQKYQGYKAKLRQWGPVLTRIGKGLTEEPAKVDAAVFLSLPTRDEFVTTMQEFKEVIAELKRTWIAARDFGFPVEDITSEVGPL